MDHSAYVGKLTDEENLELLRELLQYLNLKDAASVFKNELDETDYEEFKFHINQV